MRRRMKVEWHIGRHLLLVSVVVCAIGCGTVEHTDDTVTSVRGTVTDSVSGIPIVGAALYIDDTTQVSAGDLTDSSGSYHVYSWGDADWTIYCLKDDFSTKSRHVTGSDEITGVNFQLVPESR
ncbi:hypothetical protein GF420_10945 [candidate division GN15 bacterium]|nr:hypothetical protein [candidate division GN15 bacterium]